MAHQIPARASAATALFRPPGGAEAYADLTSATSAPRGLQSAIARLSRLTIPVERFLSYVWDENAAEASPCSLEAAWASSSTWEPLWPAPSAAAREHGGAEAPHIFTSGCPLTHPLLLPLSWGVLELIE